MSDMGPGPCDVCGEDLEAHTGKQLRKCSSQGYIDSIGGPGRIDAEVLRQGGMVRSPDPLFGNPDAASLGSPVPHGEPPIYTVVSFRIRHGGRVYDYAAVRAGDGKWYATGGETKQGVDWETLVRACRPKLVGPITILGPVQQVFV